MRKLVVDKPNAAQLLYAACDNYCNSSKRVLRSTIQSVDRIVEEHASLKHRSPLKSLQLQNHQPATQTLSILNSPSIAANMVIRTRELLLTQKALVHWKMYCFARKLKRSADRHQVDMLHRLESAQKLAEGAKSEVHMVEQKDTHLRDELIKSQAENAAIRDRTGRLEGTIADLQQQISSTAAENENLRTANKRLMSSSGSKSPSAINHGESEKMRSVQNDLRLLNEQLQHSDETAQQLSAEIRKVRQDQQKEKGAMRAELESLSAEKTRIESELESLKKSGASAETRSSRGSSEKEVHELKQTLNERDARIRHLEEVLARESEPKPKEDNSKSKEEIQRLNSQIGKLTEKLKFADDDIKQLSLDLKQADEDMDALQALKDKAEAQLKESQNRVAEMTAEKRAREASPTGPKATRIEVAKLHEQCEQYAADLRAAETELQTIVADRNKADAEVASLTTQLVAAKRAAQDAQSKLATVKTESDSAKTKLEQELADALSTQSELIQTARSAHAEKESEIARLRASLTERDAEIAKLTNTVNDSTNEARKHAAEGEKKVKKLVDELAAAKAEVLKTQSAEASVRNSLAEAESKLQLSQRDSSRSEANEKSLRAAVSELRAKLSAAEIEMGKFEEAHGILRSGRDEASNQLIASEKEVRRLASVEIALRRRVSELQGELAALIEEGRKSVATEASLRHDVVNLQKQLSENTARLSSVEADLKVADAEVDRLTAEAAASAAKNSTAVVSSTDTDARVATLSAENERLRADLATKEAAEKDLVAQIELLDSDLSAAENEIEDLNTRLVELDSGDARGTSVKMLQDELDAKNQAETELRARIEELELAYEKIDRKLKTSASDAASASFVKSSEELVTIQAELVRVKQQLDEAATPLQAMQLKLSMAESATAAREAELASLREQLEAKRAEAEMTLTARERELALVRDELAKLESEKSKLEVKITDMKSFVNSTDNSLQNALTEKEFEISEVREELASTKRDLELATGDLAQAVAEMDELDRKLKAKTDAVAVLEKSVAELEVVKADNSDLRIGAAAAKADLDRIRAEKKALESQLSSKSSADSRIVELSSALADAETAKAKLQADLLRVDTEASLARAERAQLEARLADLESAIKGKRQRMSIAASVGFVSMFGSGKDEEVVALLQAAARQAEARQVELLEERVKLEAVIAAKDQVINELRQDSARANSSDGLLATIHKLVDEKTSLTDRLTRMEQLLETREKGKVHSLEMVIKDIVSQANPPILLMPLSQHVSVDAGGSVASYVGLNKDSDMTGCLITTAPLPMFNEGVYFEVRVTSASSGNPDGLTVGITTTQPWQGHPVPNTLDDIPQTWAVGYNGQTWNSAKSEWKQIAWCGKDLAVGQRVGVLVAAPPVSQLFVFVDDVLACRGPARLPACTDHAFYGLIDLLGNCDSVTLLWGAKPPSAAAELVPVIPAPSMAQFKLPSRRHTVVTPPMTDGVTPSPIMSPKRHVLPKLALRPTAEPNLPVRPPSTDSDQSILQ